MLHGPAWSGSIQQDLIERLWVAILTCDSSSSAPKPPKLSLVESIKESESEESGSDTDSDTDSEIEDTGLDALTGSCALVDRTDLFSMINIRKQLQLGSETVSSGELPDGEATGKGAENETEPYNEQHLNNTEESEPGKECISNVSGSNITPEVNPSGLAMNCPTPSESSAVENRDVKGPSHLPPDAQHTKRIPLSRSRIPKLLPISSLSSLSEFAERSPSKIPFKSCKDIRTLRGRHFHTNKEGFTSRIPVCIRQVTYGNSSIKSRYTARDVPRQRFHGHSTNNSRHPAREVPRKQKLSDSKARDIRVKSEREKLVNHHRQGLLNPSTRTQGHRWVLDSAGKGSRQAIKEEGVEKTKISPRSSNISNRFENRLTEDHKMKWGSRMQSSSSRIPPKILVSECHKFSSGRKEKQKCDNRKNDIRDKAQVKRTVKSSSKSDNAKPVSRRPVESKAKPVVSMNNLSNYNAKSLQQPNISSNSRQIKPKTLVSQRKTASDRFPKENRKMKPDSTKRKENKENEKGIPFSSDSDANKELEQKSDRSVGMENVTQANEGQIEGAKGEDGNNIAPPSGGESGTDDSVHLEHCLKDATLGVMTALPEGWVLVPEHTAEMFSSLLSVIESFPRPHHAHTRVISALLAAHNLRPCTKGEIHALNNAHLLLYIALKLCCVRSPADIINSQQKQQTNSTQYDSHHPQHTHLGQQQEEEQEMLKRKIKRKQSEELKAFIPHVSDGDDDGDAGGEDGRNLVVQVLTEILKCEGSFDRLMLCLLLGSAAPGRGYGWYCETDSETEKERDLRFILNHARHVKSCKVSEMVSAPLWSCGSSPVVVAALSEKPRLVLTLLQYGAGGSSIHYGLYSKCYTNGIYLAIAYLVRKLEEQQRTIEEDQEEEEEEEDVLEHEELNPRKSDMIKFDLLTQARNTPAAACLRYLLRAVPLVPSKFLRDQVRGTCGRDVAELLPRQCCLATPSLTHFARVATRNYLRRLDLLPHVVQRLAIPPSLKDSINLLRD